MARILAGKPFAKRIHAEVATDIKRLAAAGHVPGLAIVLVGDDPASQTYVGRKQAACRKLGINSWLERMPATGTTADVHAQVKAFNEDGDVDGILVQQPLPRQVDTTVVVRAVDPIKDVDGLHPLSVGFVTCNVSGLHVACTPKGCLRLLRDAGITIKGQRATVVGRSMIVGRPLSLLLDQAGATVTVCHSATPDLAAACRTADILAVAVGQPNLVTAAMVKPGATVLDIGISAGPDGKLRGDVDHEAAAAVAANITPVPGGVGPLTVAMLMRNTVDAALARRLS